MRKINISYWLTFSFIFVVVLLMASLVQTQQGPVEIETPAEINHCESYQFNVTITPQGKYPINLTVTVPTGFIYDSGSSTANFSGTLNTTIEPSISGNNLTWNFNGQASQATSTQVGFNLTPGCGAASGKRLRAVVYFNDSTSASKTSNSILVNIPFITLKIDPEVADAHLNDTVMYSIIVKNTGTSPAYNVSLNATLTNLTLVNISTTSLNWSYDRINASETKTETINVTVAACDGQFMNVTMSRSCLGSVCRSIFAKGSIRFMPRIPEVMISVNDISINYCQNTTVRVNLSNEGESGAYDLYLRMAGLPSQYVSNPNATFYPGNSTFYINDIPPNGTFNLTFDLGMSYGNCTDPGSGTIAIFPRYYDECLNLWAPPVNLFHYSFNASSRPGLSATKTANRSSLYFGEMVEFNLSATYTKGICPNDSVNVTITDHYHEKLAVIDDGGGTVNESAHTITWSNVFLQHGTLWNQTLKFRANVTCSCGQTLPNSMTVIAGTDCCGCPLNASASESVIVECYNDSVFSSSKTATPSPQEVCRTVTYNTTYVFNRTLNWSDVSFMEVGNNNQTFPDGLYSGTASFFVNGTKCNESTITLEQWVNLGTVNFSACSDKIYPGTTLEITYTLKQNDDGNFPDWSYLNISGYRNTDCPDPGFYREAGFVNVDRPAMSIAVDIADWINVCGEYNVTITASKSGVFPVYNITIYFNDSLYRYIDNTTNMSSFKNVSGGNISSFEPTRNGTILSWYLGNLSSGGTIQFRAVKNCSLAPNAVAWLDYQDNCDLASEEVRHAGDSDSPLIITIGDIIILKTPKVIFAKTKNVSWNIYVTNKGNGTAKNVTVVDVLDDDLIYVSSSIDGILANPSVTGNHTIVWSLGDIIPNKRRRIQLNATFAGCQWLENTVNASWGCCNESCQIREDQSHVEILEGVAVFVRHDGDLIDECGGTANFTIIARNVGETYVYDARAIEILPSCIEFVPNTNTSAPTATSFSYYSGNKTLTWYYDALAPGSSVDLGFKAVVNQSCICNATFGAAIATINYTIPCGDYGAEDVKPFETEKAAPHLSITKTPPFTIAENSSLVNWTITITSDGDYEAKNITLQDVLPSNTVYDATNISPAVTSGTGTVGNPLVWNLGNMSIGNVTTINVSARVTGCTNDTENNATVFWGCCVPKQEVSASATLRTQPVLMLDKVSELDTCSGNMTLTIENEGSSAVIVNMTEYLPNGYDYVPTSANITSDNASHTITNPEPVVIDPDYILWNSTNVEVIYPNETLTINLSVINTKCSQSYCEKVYHTNETFVINYTDSCTNPLTINQTWDVDPVIMEIRVHKEPPTQVVGFASWTINISSYNATADNVTVKDELGSAFHSISTYYLNGNLDNSATNTTLPSGNKEVLWTGQTVSLGDDTWIRRVTAQVNVSGTADNNVTVIGYCTCGCIYSMHGDLVYASRLNFTKVPNGTLTIGEYANFTLTAEYWGDGEDYINVTITDALPEYLAYISSNITDDDGVLYNDNLTQSYNGTTKLTYLSWNLDTFTGPKVFTINLTTIVNNTLGNQNGSTVWNNAYSVHENEYNETFQAYDSAWVAVIEPDLVIAKSTNKTIVVAGDVVEYTVKVYHTAQSAHDAYDVWINDTVPAKLDILSNTSNPTTDLSIQAGHNFSWFYGYVPLSYNASNPINITYVVRVNTSVIIGEELMNNATVTWTSVNETTGNESFERFGNWTDLDDYNDTAEAPITANTTRSMEKLPQETRYRTIGEGVNFTIKVYLPLTNVLAVWVNDTLSTGLIYDNTTVTLTANNDTFQETISGPNNGTQPTTVRWYLGTVNNTDGTNITIDFTAIVADVGDNQNGTILNNTATFSWEFANGTKDMLSNTSGDIIVLEPDLQISKQFNVSVIEAGAVINFTVVVNHTAASAWDAFDLWINDTVPDKLADINCSVVPEPNQTADHAWYFTRLNLSDTITVTCTARINETIELNETLENIVNLTWTSTPETNPYEDYERFGNRTELDDYNRTAADTLTGADTLSLAKTVDKQNATIGEYLTYTIIVGLPNVTVNNVTINDTLPSDLAYDRLISLGAGGNNETLVETVEGQNISWYLGDVNNSDGSNITIVFRAVVRDISANQNNTYLGNNSVIFTGYDVTGNEYNRSAESVDVLVVEPDLAIEKQVNTTIVEAGDVVTYTLNVSHTSNSTTDAYDVFINDTLPEHLAFISETSTGAVFTQAGQNLSWFYAHIPLVNDSANPVVISYTASVTDEVIANETLRNIVNLTWTSVNETFGNESHERFGNYTDLDDYNETNSTVLTGATNWSINKTVDRTNATIGEYVNYTLLVDLPNVHVLNLSVEDVLEQGLIYFTNVSSVAPDNFSVSPPNGGSQNVTVTFGYDDFNNSAGDDLTINITTIVADVLDNQDGVNLTNLLNVSWHDAQGVMYTNSTNVSTTLVEPDLKIEKTVNDSVVEAGDVVTYTVNVSHTTSSTTDAYNVFINDTLPEHLTFISETSTGAVFTQAGQNLSWFYAYIPLVNDSANPVVISYTASVTDEVIANETLRNIVNLTWTSVNETFGNESHERFGNYTDLDDYNETNSTVLTGASNWSINKTVDKPKATIGEYVNYTVQVDLPGVHVLNLTVTDVLQEGLIYHDNSSPVDPDNFTVSSPNNGSQNVTVTFEYNDFNNSLGDDLTITITAIVADVYSNQKGTELNNTVNVSWIDAGDREYRNGTNVSSTIIEPDLEINKTANVTHVEAGDLIAFNITVTHTPNSTADAYDVWINDTIPVRTDLVDNASNPPEDNFTQVGRDLSWYYAHVPLAQILNITYTVRVNESVSPLDILTNNATLTWTGVNATMGNESHERFGGRTVLDDYNDSDSQNVTVWEAELYKEPDVNRSYWINDSVGYRISLVLPYATVLNTTVNDTLPQGLIFDNASVVVDPNHTYNLSFSEPNNGTQPVNITFDFGNLLDGTIVNITFTTIVADIPANQNGTILTQNFAQLFWNDNEGGLHNDSNTSGNITVIRLPRINLTDGVIKIVEPEYVIPGAFVNYTVYITNDGFAPAYNVTLFDMLPNYVSYIPNTTMVHGVPGPNPDTITLYPNGTTKIAWTNVIDVLNASETKWVRYACSVSSATPFEEVLINNATVEKFEDEEGKEYPGASDSAILKVITPVPVLNAVGLIILTGSLMVVAIGRMRKGGKGRRKFE